MNTAPGIHTTAFDGMERLTNTMVALLLPVFGWNRLSDHGPTYCKAGVCLQIWGQHYFRLFVPAPNQPGAYLKHLLVKDYRLYRADAYVEQLNAKPLLRVVKPTAYILVEQ